MIKTPAHTVHATNRRAADFILLALPSSSNVAFDFVSSTITAPSSRTGSISWPRALPLLRPVVPLRESTGTSTSTSLGVRIAASAEEEAPALGSSGEVLWFVDGKGMASALPTAIRLKKRNLVLCMITAYRSRDLRFFSVLSTRFPRTAIKRRPIVEVRYGLWRGTAHCAHRPSCTRFANLIGVMCLWPPDGKILVCA